jgi:hypothetical protein
MSFTASLHSSERLDGVTVARRVGKCKTRRNIRQTEGEKLGATLRGLKGAS